MSGLSEPGTAFFSFVYLARRKVGNADLSRWMERDSTQLEQHKLSRAQGCSLGDGERLSGDLGWVVLIPAWALRWSSPGTRSQVFYRHRKLPFKTVFGFRSHSQQHVRKTWESSREQSLTCKTTLAWRSINHAYIKLRGGGIWENFEVHFSKQKSSITECGDLC